MKEFKGGGVIPNYSPSLQPMFEELGHDTDIRLLERWLRVI